MNWSDFTHRRGSVRSDAALVMIVVGGFCVVVGGLVAAVTEPLELEHGSWLAAYLVLVGGVAQYAMGRIRKWWHSESARSTSWAWAQLGGWNLGNAGVIAGTLASTPLIVDVGSVLLAFALLIALRATWSAAARFTDPTSTLIIWTYRILLLVLVVSIPVGILLSHLRNS